MKKLVILFIIGISISILVACFKTSYYLIRDFEFYGAELKYPQSTIEENKYGEVSDTLRNKLYFKIVAIGEYQYTASLNKISLINQCYATSKPQKLNNTILLDELVLKLNSDIYFESEVIEKGTDLWNHPKLKEYKWFYSSERYSSHVYYGVIGFIYSFYDKVVIPQKDYTIEMTCETSDNQVVTKSIELYLKL